MTGNKVDISVSTTDKNTENVLNRIERSVDKIENKFAKVGRTGNRSSKQIKSGFDSSLATFGKFAGAITGVGSLVGGVALVTNQLFVELRNLKSLQQTDADKQVEFESALVGAVRNAGGNFKSEEIKAEILELEKDTGVRPAIIANVVSSTLSARGATNKAQAQEAIEGTRAALNFAPELNSEDAAILAGSSVDIAKKTGFTPEESIGLAQNVGALAHVSKPRDLAQNVAPAMNALLDFNNSAQEAGSLIAAMTQGTNDFTGNMSRTASIQLAKQIEERGIGNSTAEGIQLLQQDPKLRKKFEEGGTFNGKSFPAVSTEANAFTTVRNLLNPDTQIAKAFNEGIDKIGDRQDAQKTYDDLVAEVKKVTRTSRLRRQAAAATDTANIEDVVGGMAAETRTTLSKALDAANFSDLRKKFILQGETEACKQRKAKIIESWRFYLRGLWCSGLRLSESLELYWDREDKLSLDFSRKHPMMRIRAESEKGNKDRLLPIVPEFAQFLQSVPEDQRTGPVFNPLAVKRYRDRMTPTAISKKVADIGELANVVVGDKGNIDKETGERKPRYASAHDLRRSFGERWSLKVMPQALMQLMRHESMETTLKYYVGRNADKVADAIWSTEADPLYNSLISSKNALSEDQNNESQIV